VSGWATADAALRGLAADRANASGGAYLAPWLLHAPLLDGPVARLVALRYDPTDEPPQAYLAALSRAFRGEPASGTGYAAWLAARGSSTDGPVRLYAAARLAVPGSVGHGHADAGWLPGGRLTAVTTPLDGGQ